MLGGTGTAVVGETEHPLRAGSFLLRPPGSQVPHAIDAGPDGLRYVTMGDLVAGDVCVYPDSGKAEIAPGLMVRTETVDCFDGEPDATI